MKQNGPVFYVSKDVAGPRLGRVFVLRDRNGVEHGTGPVLSELKALALRFWPDAVFIRVANAPGIR